MYNYRGNILYIVSCFKGENKMDNWLEREELLIGNENVKKLNKSIVAVFGCGGVGSYAVEGLARAGIGNFIIVDNDIVDITNINRQIIADVTTIGKYKVEIEKARILNINPQANVEVYKEFYCEENADKLMFSNYTYIVDAIDSVKSKILLIEKAHKRNINIISAMGMGNKINPTMIEVSDISKTEVCPLAKIVRKNLRNLGINHTKVVYSKEGPKMFNTKENNAKTTASISFVPSVAGLIIAGEVIKDIIQGKK